MRQTISIQIQTHEIRFEITLTAEKNLSTKMTTNEWIFNFEMKKKIDRKKWSNHFVMHGK